MANFINMVAVQNLLMPFYCVLEKNTSFCCDPFLCLAVLASSYKFQFIFLAKTKNQNIKLQHTVNILASPKADGYNHFSTVSLTLFCELGR